jgi:hypothetical protein
MIGASSLRSCVGMRSGPAALCTFRFDRSLNTPFSVISIDLAKSMDLSEQIDLILLDFSKAFDKVPHERLLY